MKLLRIPHLILLQSRNRLLFQHSVTHKVKQSQVSLRNVSSVKHILRLPANWAHNFVILPELDHAGLAERVSALSQDLWYALVLLKLMETNFTIH